MKLNLGCGMNRRDGWHNVDNSPVCQPDQVWDLEQTPWPWPDSSAQEFLFNHSLEHMGQDTKTFLAIMSEVYRVGRPGAEVSINVPHPRHDNFLFDPTHVRAVTPEMLMMFDKEKNEQWVRASMPNTPLGLYLSIDLQMIEATMILDEPYLGRFRAGELKAEEISQLARERNNVIAECRIKLKVRKPAS
ncbi:MAG: hypothetical protein R3C31_13430 [Hyphomonadaceae bacterium]